jgi:PIN domain nuclease of toxin-antitoxin system
MGTVGYLLDTHTFLWAVRNSPKLSEKVKHILEDKNVKKYISAVSAYEIMNKHRIGKLEEFDDIANNYLAVFDEFGADDLTIKTRHSHFAGEIEWEHRDPFDRLLAAQASIENLTLITNDPIFQTLPLVSVVW